MIKKMFKHACRIAVLATPLVASAGVIIQPTAVTSAIDPLSGSYHLTSLINQSLSLKYVSGVTDFETFMASKPTDENSSAAAWAGTQGVYSGSFTFALGNAYNIESLALWDRAPVGQGVRDFRLYASSSADFASSTLLGDFTAAEGNNAAASQGQVFEFANTSASFVRMDVLNTYGNCCISMSEVAFEAGPAVSAVPEPGSITLMSGAMLGLVGSRRRFWKRGG